MTYFYKRISTARFVAYCAFIHKLLGKHYSHFKALNETVFNDTFQQELLDLIQPVKVMDSDETVVDKGERLTHAREKYMASARYLTDRYKTYWAIEANIKAEANPDFEGSLLDELGLDDYGNAGKDPELMIIYLAKCITKIGEYAIYFTQAGMSNTFVTKLQTTLSQLENYDSSVDLQKDTRGESTTERHEGKEKLELKVRAVCRAGKTIWYYDERRKKLFNFPSGKSKPSNILSIDANTQQGFMEGELDIDTIFDFENKGLVPLKVFAGENTAIATPPNAKIVLPNATERIPIAEITVDGNVNMLIISNETTVNGKYRITIE